MKWTWDKIMKSKRKRKIIGEMGKDIHKIGGHPQKNEMDLG